MQFVFYLRGKKGAVMPRGGHFVPCSDIFNRVPAGHWDAAWATRFSSWQTACALHRGRADCLSKALSLTQYAGPRLASKGYECSKESLCVLRIYRSLCVYVDGFCRSDKFSSLLEAHMQVMWILYHVLISQVSQNITESWQWTPWVPIVIFSVAQPCFLSVNGKQTSISSYRRL